MYAKFSVDRLLVICYYKIKKLIDFRESHYMYEFQKKKLKQLLGEGNYKLFHDNNCILAGGAIRSIFCNNEVNDFDIYFKSADEFLKVAKYFGMAICHTDKATLYSDNDRLIQLIHFKLFDSVEEVFEVFDFVCCMGAYDFGTEEFVLADKFLEDNACKQLTFNEATQFPIVSALRVDKYKEKGYSISKSEYIRVLLTCMKLPVNSWKELKHHMGGMYGINLDKLFKDDEPFSLDVAIKQLANLYLREDYNEYMLKTEIKPIGFNELIQDIKFVNFKQDAFKFKDKWYYLDYNNDLNSADDFKDIAKSNLMSVKEFFTKHPLYKNIKKTDDGYVSYCDGFFKYKLGQEVVAEDKDVGLFFCIDKEDCLNDSEEDKVTVVAVTPNEEDILSLSANCYSSTVQLTKVIVYLDKE